MSGHQIGYIRDSSIEQSTARQLADMKFDHTFEDRASGKHTAQPQLTACPNHLRRGDTLHVHSMDRLARNLDDLRKMVRDLTERGVVVKFHKEGLQFTNDSSPMSNLLLSMLGAAAEFERSLILERRREGIAKAAGVYKGRKPSMTAEQVSELRLRVANRENKTALAKEFKISRQTLYKNLEPMPISIDR